MGKDSGSNEVASYSDDDLIRSLRAQMTSFTEDNSPVKDLNCSLEQQLVNLEVDNSLNLIEIRSLGKDNFELKGLNSSIERTLSINTKVSSAHEETFSRANKRRSLLMKTHHSQTLN